MTEADKTETSETQMGFVKINDNIINEMRELNLTSQYDYGMCILAHGYNKVDLKTL